MAGKANPFSLIQLQEKALRRMHEPRSSESRAARNRAASLRQYRKSVERLGFSAMQIQAQMRDILDVWKLQRDAEGVIE